MSGGISMVLRKVENFGCSLWEIEKKNGAETLPQNAPQANKLLVVGWIVEEYVHGHREVTP